MANRYGPRIATDGLVLCLDAANRDSYPGSGSTWYDLSGNDNHGTLYGSYSYETAKEGRIYFNGGAYGDFGMSNLTLTEFTFSVWLTSLSTNTQCIIGKGRVNQQEEWSLSFGGSTQIYGRMRTYSDSVGYTYTPFLNQDHMITMSAKSGTFVKLYIDGGLVNEKTTSVGSIVNDLNYSLQIGKWYDYNPATYFRMYKASVYSKALSDDEVLQNYNATRGRFGL